MKVDTLLTLWTKNIEQQSLELSLLKNNRFENSGSEISEIYIDKSLNHTKKF